MILHTKPPVGFRHALGCFQHRQGNFIRLLLDQYSTDGRIGEVRCQIA